MPAVLYSIDGAYRATIFQGSQESRERLRRAAGPGDRLIACGCRMPHFAMGEAMRCQDRVLTATFHAAGREPTIDHGPAFSTAEDRL